MSTEKFERVLALLAPEQQADIRKACDRTPDLVEYYARLQPQVFVTAQSGDQLPRFIERKCCQYKSCGNAHLTLETYNHYVPADESAELFRRVESYAYVRDNGDVFWRGDLDEILTCLNDATWYPVEDEPRS